MSQTSTVCNTSCCLDGCSSSRAKNPNLSFHKFPTKNKSSVYIVNEQGLREKVDRYKAWIQSLKLRKRITKTATICSLHFTRDDFILPDCPSQKPRLKNTAVPHLNNQNSWIKRSVVYRGPGKKNVINRKVGDSTSRKRLKMKNVSKQMDEFNARKTKHLLKFPEYSRKISVDGSKGTVNQLERIYANEPEVKDFEKDNKFEVLYLTPVKFESSRYSDEETSSSNSEMENEEMDDKLSSDSEHQDNEEVTLDSLQICRICLKTRKLISLIKLPSLVNLFINITRIKVEDGDDLPKYMCSDCIQKLDDISKFINMARKSDEDLKQSLFDNYERKSSVDVDEKISITEEGNSKISQKVMVTDDTIDTIESPQPSGRKENILIVKKNEDIYRNCTCWKCGVLHVGVKFPKHLSDVPLYKIKFQCRKCALFRSSPNKNPSDARESFSPTVFPDIEPNNEDRKLRCAPCSTDFPLSEYAEHQAKEHKTKKRFRCLKCLAAFSDPNLLVQHSIKHT
nr:uncharacterized protein LOC111512417 isoform X1 [Leptinotarsa decemlineata]